MLRKILVTVLTFCSLLAFAQKPKKGKHPKASDNVAQKDSVKVNYKIVGAPMPPLRVVTRKGQSITDKDLKTDATLFVMTFNPFCGHCEDVTELLKTNISLFKNTKLVLVTAETMMPNLEYFENNLKMADFPSITVGVDSSGYIDKTFLYQNLPQINIYNKDRKLERVFTGEHVVMDSLKRYIQ